MVGQTISHYKILEKLGEGGMGVVYKAEDIKLKRTVAVKFLPHQITSTEEEEARFMQEAQAAATLNHPNVCTIHAIEEAGEKQFIVMEYVDGVTLREKIAAGAPARTAEAGGHRDAALPMKDVISYGIQVGEALQEAHSKGIVHRDIKADNIMVNSKNQVKVMDFGLAKLKGSLKLTRSSSTVGTLAYMAPEQIQGGEVDARSDIFSFGVVLYEMLTGRTPFRGEHDAAMMYSILNEEPEPADKLRSDISPELLHILNRAIEKDPEDRYQTAHEMVIDLRRLKKESSRVSRAPLTATPPAGEAAGAPRKPRRRLVAAGAAVAGLLVLGLAGYLLFLQPSREVGGGITVAVADFVNETGENELNGLSGMLITALEQSRRLTVLPRSRMFDILKQMGNADVDQIDESTGRQICSYAHINALAVASIRKFGRLYTIDLKMLDPIKNEYLFTAKVDGEGQESVPSMIDQLSEKTRVGLNEKVSEIEKTSQSVAQVTTTNLEAYQHFFIGEQLVGKLKFKEAIDELKKAIALDSTFALAYYRLAYARAWGSEPNAKGSIRAALKYISKAPEKEKLLIRAEAEAIDGDVDQALAIYQQVLKEYPDEKEALYNFGDYSFHRGDFQSAIKYLGRVLELDPTFDRAYEHITWTYASLGQYDTMTKFAQDFVAKAPGEEAYELLGAAYRLQEEYNAAFETLQKGVELYPQSAALVIEIGRTNIAQGNADKAEQQFRKLLDKGRKPTERSTGYKSMASLSAYLGQYRRAIEFLEKALEVDETISDRTDLALCYAQKAYWFARAWGNAAEAKSAIAKSKEFKEAANLFVYFALIDTYVILGDFLEASEIATNDISAALPLFRDNVKAANRMANKQFNEAVQEYTSLLEKENYFAKPAGKLSVARCYFEIGQYDRAIEALQPIAHTFAEGFSRDLRDLDVYPRSLYWLGKTYERKGDREEAIRHFERFLKLWKDADRDLPELIDAKERVASLKGTTSN